MKINKTSTGGEMPDNNQKLRQEAQKFIKSKEITATAVGISLYIDAVLHPKKVALIALSVDHRLQIIDQLPMHIKQGIANEFREVASRSTNLLNEIQERCKNPMLIALMALANMTQKELERAARGV